MTDAPTSDALAAHPEAAALVRQLGLQPHLEGGWYRELHRSAQQVDAGDGRGARPAITTIYFLLVAGTQSRWHRVASDEVWHLYGGDPLEVLELSADLGTLVRHRLAPVGIAVADGAPVCVIPAGAWQAARPLGAWTLVGCSVGPGFDFADFTMLADEPATAAAVRARHPDVAALT